MSLDSRRTGFTRLTAPNNRYTIKAHPGLLPPNQQHNDQQPQPEVEITYADLRTIGNGSFGIVFQATLLEPTHEQIAIKKVLQDKRFKNRELQIMRKLDHCNVVKLKYFFHTFGDHNSTSEVYLHLVLEYIPETLYKIARTHSRTRQNLPMLLVKLYMYQLFRSLNYIHSMDICHRDIKPQNLLLDPESGVLKLCDFGSAKSLVSGEQNVAYICSRYYRAPELIFGATDYTTKIDIWSAGCVMAELILGEPMFPGESGVDQLVEIIKVLGTPTREQMGSMNPNYTDFRFPVIKARSWSRIFNHLNTPPEAARLVSNLLDYTPTNRLTPLDACAHPFFDELRTGQQVLPSGRPFPPLFNFSDEELRKEPDLAPRLRPGGPNVKSEPLSQQQPDANTANSTPSPSTSSNTGPGPLAASSSSVGASKLNISNSNNSNKDISNAATNDISASSTATAPTVKQETTTASNNLQQIGHIDDRSNALQPSSGSSDATNNSNTINSSIDNK